MTPSAWPWAHTAGSLCPADMMLMMAFHEQLHNTGWYHACLGHLASNRNRQYPSMTPPLSPIVISHLASILVNVMWKFVSAMWSQRNSVVNGDTIDPQAFYYG
jgi:hypothetical protein